MALVQIPINQGSFENADYFEHGSSGTAQIFKNMLINDAGSNIARPALSSFATIDESPVIGMKFFANKICVVTEERKIYSVDQGGGVTEITDSALGGASRPVFATDGETLAIAGGGTPREWTGSGNTNAMAGSPPDCTFMSYLDGYWITHLISDQELRWAGPTSSTRDTWNSSNFFQAEGLPDNILAQAVLLRELYVFGFNSTEIFYNYGDSSVPFKRTFFIDTGISAPYSIAQADNTLFWLDHNRKIVQMQGRTPVFISTPFDKTIKGFNVVSDCWAETIDIEGNYLIAWTFPTEERTFVYDYKGKYWSEWDGFVDGLSSRIPFNAYVYVKEWNRHFVGDSDTGLIWELSSSSKTDGDNIRRLVRRTGQINHGTRKRKRSNYYLFNVKRGLGTPGETEPVFEVRVNDDNKGWTDPIQVPLGYSGDIQEPIRVNIRGIYRNRQIEIKVTDPIEFVLNSIEEEVEELNT